MLSIEEREYQKVMINTFGGISDCDCKNCNGCDDTQLEECYSIATSHCNSESAEAINYGGYDSEEEFWDNILE